MDDKSQDVAASQPTPDFLPSTNVAEAILKLQQTGLGSGSQRITELILDRPRDVMGMTLSQCAEAAGASDSLVIKVIKQAGFIGYQQLKLAISRDLGSPTLSIHEDLAIGDDYRTITRKIFSANIQALLDTEEILSPALLQSAVEILDAAKSIDIYGIGSAAPIAEDAHYRLMRIGLPVRIYVDSHLQVTTASLANRRTAVLTISHSGSTIETLDATEIAKKAGAKVVVISGYADAPLHKFADVVLQTQALETKFRTEAMTSRIAQLSIVDTLIGALALKRQEQAVKTLEKTYEALSRKRV